MNNNIPEFEFFLELEAGDTFLNFSFHMDKDGTFIGEYQPADSPGNSPKLSDLMGWIAKGLGIDSLPAETDLDADVQSLIFKVQKKGPEKALVEIAGTFGLAIEGKTWDLFFSYTNKTIFATGADSTPITGPGPYVFGVSFCGPIDLSELPLIGRIPGIHEQRIDKLGFFYTNAVFSSTQKELHFQVPQIGSDRSLAPASAAAILTQPGFSLIGVYGNANGGDSPGTLKAGGTIQMPVIPPPSPEQAGAFAVSQAVPLDPLTWLAVNKTFGPVSLEKIGISYDKPGDPNTELGVFSVYLDGAFQIAGFGMGLDRLGISFTLPKLVDGKLTFNPIEKMDFHLGGLFVDYQAPGLTIAGGFVSIPGENKNFIGEFMVGAGDFNLQAYGGFSNQLSNPSLFIFLHLQAPLGGPPFFFIKGLAGGFGVNRAFRLPTFDQLANYPLLPSVSALPTPASLSGSPQQRLETMMTGLADLASYLPVQAGEYWLAVGLDISSFEMIQVSAILSVAFGVDLRIGIVGTAAMTLPVSDLHSMDAPDPIVYLQIDFECTFSTSDGLLAVMGQITPASFIYGNFVHLTGGFAFYTWLSGPDKGDFVMTIGGYNPHYQKPSNYPDVPRMQMKFALGSLNFTGQSYFALTPQMMMAGIDVHATWSSGSLDAWFDMGMDFLINWKPYHYEADGYINIGISLNVNLLFVTIRITVHAGVDIQVWGPGFGGRASVDLDIVSFTIGFGADPVFPVVGWEEFRAFLPGADQHAVTSLRAAADAAVPSEDDKPLVSITATDGLLKQFKKGEDASGLDWLISANGFNIVTNSAAPCNEAAFNDQDFKDFTSYLKPGDLEKQVQQEAKTVSTPFFVYETPVDAPAWNEMSFGIVPMDKTAIRSKHTVSLQWKKDQDSPYADTTNLLVVLQLQNFPAALWGNGGAVDPKLQAGQELIRNALGGFSIRPGLWFPLRTTLIPYYYLVFDTNNLFLYQRALPAINTRSFNEPQTILTNMTDGTLFLATAAVRGRITTLLQQNGYPSLSLKNDDQLNTGQYLGDPMLTYMSHTNEINFEQ